MVDQIQRSVYPEAARNGRHGSLSDLPGKAGFDSQAASAEGHHTDFAGRLDSTVPGDFVGADNSLAGMEESMHSCFNKVSVEL